MNYELGIKKKAGETKLWEWLFLLFIFLLPWQTRLILRPGILNAGNWEYGIIGVYGTEMLLWLVFMIWGIRNIRYWILNIKILIKKISNIQYLIFLISLISLISISLIVSADRALAWQSWRYIFEAIVVFFLIRRHSRPGWLVGAFLFGLAIQSVLGIWQFLTQSTLASRWLGLTNHFPWAGGSAVLENAAGRWLRAYGGLPHPNILGGYLAVGLFLIILTVMNFFSDKGRDIKDIKIFKILLFIVYCLLLMALFFTFSRSAWLAFFIGLLVYWFINWRRKTISQSFNLLILGTFLFFVLYSLSFQPLVLNRFSGEGRLEVQSTSERLVGYHEAWQLFKKHPFLGVGLGNYTLAVHREIDSSRSAWAYQPVHNAFVLMISEIGIIGTALLIILLFLAAKNIKDIKILDIGYWILISNILILFFILGFFDHYLWSLYSGWMLMAAGGGLGVVYSRKTC